MVAHPAQEHAPLERVAESDGEGPQRVAIALRQRGAVGVDEPDALLVAHDRRRDERLGSGEQANRAGVRVHVLDKDHRSAPQHLGLAQARPKSIWRQAVFARGMDALGRRGCLPAA